MARISKRGKGDDYFLSLKEEFNGKYIAASELSNYISFLGTLINEITRTFDVPQHRDFYLKIYKFLMESLNIYCQQL